MKNNYKNKAYIVCVNGKPSQTAYRFVSSAIAFIISRSDNPSNVQGWHWKSKHNDYKIYEVNVEE